MKKIASILVLFYTLYFNSTIAQDVVFSNPMLSPMNLNPALTGIFNAKSRLNLIHRNQYSFLEKAAFKTFSTAYDQRIPSGKYDYFGAGLSVLADQAGSLNFRTINAKLNGSYLKRVGGHGGKISYLSIGSEIGYTKKTVDLTNGQWGSQHNGNGEFDPNLFSGSDHFKKHTGPSVDLGIGLIYFVNNNNNAKNFYIGGAYYHLNKIDQSFSSPSNSYVNRRLTFHIGGEFPIDGNSKRVRLLPQLTFHTQSPALQILTSLDTRFVLVKSEFDNISFQLGGAIRTVNNIEQVISPDALIVKAKLDYNNISVGISYDFTISKLSTASTGSGSFEIGMLYYFNGNLHRKIYCPTF